MTETKSKRGFASLDAEARKALASKGGRAAHAKGTAHQWTAEEARTAGAKGGRAGQANRLAAQEGSHGA